MTDAKNAAAVPARFKGFFDDAATFPPGLAPLRRAIQDHVARWPHPLNGAVGPIVLGLKDLPEARQIAAGLPRGGHAIEVSAVVSAGCLAEALETARKVKPELNVVAIELKTDPEVRELWIAQIRAAAAVEGLEIFVELTAGQVAEGALDLLEGTDLRLKYRTGGIEAHLFPSPEELAGVIEGAVSRSVPFKLTAGLHEAVRFTHPGTCFTHHGFLNIALATAAARENLPRSEIVRILVETDKTVLADLAATTDSAWRNSFRSFGTCSVGEPAESLNRLGLFPVGLA